MHNTASWSCPHRCATVFHLQSTDGFTALLQIFHFVFECRIIGNIEIKSELEMKFFWNSEKFAFYSRIRAFNWNIPNKRFLEHLTVYSSYRRIWIRWIGRALSCVIVHFPLWFVFYIRFCVCKRVCSFWRSLVPLFVRSLCVTLVFHSRRFHCLQKKEKK